MKRTNLKKLFCFSSLAILTGLGTFAIGASYAKSISASFNAAFETRTVDFISLIANKLTPGVESETITVIKDSVPYTFKVKNVTTNTDKNVLSISECGYIIDVTAINGMSEIIVNCNEYGYDDDLVSILYTKGTPSLVSFDGKNREKASNSVDISSFDGETNFAIVNKGGEPYVINKLSVSYSCQNGDETNTDTSLAVIDDKFIFGSGTEQDPVVLSSLFDYNNLASKIGNKDYGGYIVLDGDIEGVDRQLTASNWMGNFTGTFDGGGHTISFDYKNAKEDDGVGIFGRAEGATFKNLKLTGTIDVPVCFDVGPIAGIAAGCTFNNIESSVSIDGYDSVGGIVGMVEEESNITYCSYTGSLSSYGSVGGIAGSFMGTIANCTVGKGTTIVSETYRAGGITGDCESSSIDTCTVSATIEAGKKYCGGIVGIGDAIIQGCIVTSDAKVSASSEVGGIAGRFTNGCVQGCTVNCDVTGEIDGDGYAGGIIGYGNLGATVYESSFNGSSVIGSDYVGGICGINCATISGCNVNCDYISGRQYYGGIVGKTTGFVDYCNVGSASKGVKLVYTNLSSDFGGVAGYSNLDITYCNVYAYTYIDGSKEERAFNLGGIVGNFAGEDTYVSHIFVDTMWNESASDFGSEPYYIGKYIGTKASSAQLTNVELTPIDFNA